MLESEDFFCRSGNIISKEAAGEAIVLKLQTMEYYSLNEVATAVAAAARINFLTMFIGSLTPSRRP